MSHAERIFFKVLNEVNENRFGIISQYRLKDLIKDKTFIKNRKDLLDFIERDSHIDFLLYNKITHLAVLAIEVDGLTHDTKDQIECDCKKNEILSIYKLPLIRYNTKGTYDPTLSTVDNTHISFEVLSLKEKLKKVSTSSLLMVDPSKINH